MRDPFRQPIGWFASLLGSTGYLGLTLYLLVGLSLFCPERAVETDSLQNLAILLGYGAVFAFVWFAAPPNPLLKIVSELGAALLFVIEMFVVVTFGVAVYLLDGKLTPLGC